MERNILKRLLSPTGMIVLVGLAWPFGITATQLLAEQAPIDSRLDRDFLPLLVLFAFGGLPIMVVGLCRMKSFQRVPTIELVMSVTGLTLLWVVGLATTVFSVGCALMTP